MTSKNKIVLIFDLNELIKIDLVCKTFVDLCNIYIMFTFVFNIFCIYLKDTVETSERKSRIYIQRKANKKISILHLKKNEIFTLVYHVKNY